MSKTNNLSYSAFSKHFTELFHDLSEDKKPELKPTPIKLVQNKRLNSTLIIKTGLIHLGSFVVCLEENEVYQTDNLSFKSNPLNDFVSKSNNSYKHSIILGSTCIYNNNAKILEFSHEIWQFLLIFDLVKLKAEIIDSKKIKVSVFLTQKAI